MSTTAELNTHVTPELLTHAGRPLFVATGQFTNSKYPGFSLVTFDCPFCELSHAHKWKDDSDPATPQHQRAGCRNPSPLCEGGYYLVLADSLSTHADTLNRKSGRDDA